MDETYKLEEFSTENLLENIFSENDQYVEAYLQKKNGKKNLSPREIQNEKIRICFTQIYVEGDDSRVIQALSKILSYANNNYFEDVIPDDLRKILDFATYCGKNSDEIQSKHEQIDEISKKASQLLCEMLSQPEIAKIFYSIGGIAELIEYPSETWSLLCFSEIAMASQPLRDEIFGFGVFSEFKDHLLQSPMLFYGDDSLDAICKLSESLVNFEMTMKEENEVAKTVFSELYDLIIDAPVPQFLESARKLIMHAQWADKYDDEHQIFDIFPLFPSAASPTDEIVRPIIPFISDNLISCLEHQDQTTEQWSVNSAKYIHEWLYYYSNAKYQPLLKNGQISIDLCALWRILLDIMVKANYIREAVDIAATALIKLVQVDFENFFHNAFYAVLIDLFPVARVGIKKKITAIISIAFSLARSDQIIVLQQQPHIFDVIFEYIMSETEIKYTPYIIKGLYNFIGFCGLSEEGKAYFRDLILSNSELESWLDNLICNDSGDELRNEVQKLAMNLKELIQKRVNEYKKSLE